MAKRRKRGLSGLGMPTTKDFVRVAEILCRNKASHGLVSDFASYFGSQNPRFDVNRFATAASCKRR